MTLDGKRRVVSSGAMIVGVENTSKDKVIENQVVLDAKRRSMMLGVYAIKSAGINIFI